MWGELEGETILIGKRKPGDLWAELDDETLVIRPTIDIWSEIHSGAQPPHSGLGVWAQVGDETLHIAPAEASPWRAVARSGDFRRRKPTRRLGWALKKLQTVGGEAYYVLKNQRTGAYLRLNERQVFLWHLMDGQHRIRDIAVAYFAQYQSLALENLLNFIKQLETRGFLVETSHDVYNQTAEALGQGRLARWWKRLVAALTQTTFSLRGIDPWLKRLYQGGVFLFFTTPVQILFLVTTLTGLIAWGYHTTIRGFSVLKGGGSQLVPGLVGLYAAQFIAILLHESAHAFTCVHFGRQVPRAGFMLYLGMPAFFVDTSDIWMEPRRPRILVSLAGPYAGFFLAASASLVIFFMPSQVISGLLYQFAFVCILLSFFNLNPLLHMDGYYILMDWLEMPLLRDRALNFIRRDLWRKLSTGASFNRDDKIFAIFGLLSLAWTVVAVAAALLMLVIKLSHWIS
jgi:putative peptide zinc metalloprotease protein